MSAAEAGRVHLDVDREHHVTAAQAAVGRGAALDDLDDLEHRAATRTVDPGRRQVRGRRDQPQVGAPYPPVMQQGVPENLTDDPRNEAVPLDPPPPSPNRPKAP